jgi:hypothetical protein
MIRRTLIRDLANRSRVVVHLELREKNDTGDLSPAFAVTSEVLRPTVHTAASPATVTTGSPIASDAGTTPRLGRSPSWRR